MFEEGKLYKTNDPALAVIATQGGLNQLRHKTTARAELPCRFLTCENKIKWDTTPTIQQWPIECLPRLSLTRSTISTPIFG